MKVLLLLICLLIASLDASAQRTTEQKIDSLRRIINNETLTVDKRLRAYNSILFSWVNYQKDSAYHYLAAYRKEVIAAKQEGRLASVYYYENRLLLYEGDYLGARKAARNRLRIGLAYNNKKAISGGYSDLGNSFQKAGKLDSALYYYYRGLKTANKLGQKTTSARSLINISETYKLKGQYVKALNLAQEALDSCNKYKFDGYYATIYGLVGEILLEVEDFSKAKANFKKAILAAKKFSNIKKLASSYELLSKCQLKTKDYLLAKENLLESIKLGKQAQIKTIEGRALWKLAELYLIQNLPQKALSNILRSEELLREKKDQLELINCLRVKGDIYNHLQNYSNAKEACLQAQAINQKTGKKADEIKICYCLFQAYKGTHELDKALPYIETYNRLKDSLMNFSITRKITQIEDQKVYNAKVLSDSLVTVKKLAKQELTHEQDSAKQRVFLIISVLVLFFVIVLYLLNRRKQKELRIKNTKIENQKVTIEKSLDEKELLLKEIHHRVKNNLQIISSLLELQSISVDDNNASEALLEGQTRVKSMALIHQKLYQNDNIAIVDFHDYVKDMLLFLKTIYPNADKVSTQIDIKDIELDIDTAIPLGLILNELLSNSFKYAFETTEKPRVHISATMLREGEYLLTVEDNGKGLPEDFNIRKLNSLGMKLVKRLVQQLFGRIELKNENGLKVQIKFQDTELRKMVD